MSKLLVVDDEPDVEPLIRQRFRRQLRAGEYSLVFALNGQAALEALAEHPDVDVVVTDLNMPELDGLGLLARLREQGPAWLRTIVVTAYGDMKNIRTAMNRGAVDFLTKPIDFDDLELTIRKATALARESRAALRNERERVQAEAASAAKSLFVAELSHELRNPMNSVVGMCELLGGTELDAVQREYAEQLAASCQAVLGLLDGVLDLSRIEAGRLELVRAPLAPRQVAGQALGIVSHEAARKGLELAAVVAPDVPEWILGDAGRLRQVLLNLLGNACKFTDAGRVDLELRRVGEALECAVRDTGLGIPPERRDAIFGAFAQGDAETSRRFGGTGLGLAVCARIVAAWGGTLAVESEVGAGSTFRFTHPLEPSGPPAPGDAPAAERGLRILLADDSADNRFVISRLLAGTPHQVDTVEDGQAALDALATTDYELLLLDMDMPVMDGFAAAAAVRARERASGRSALPIVALTAYALEEQRRRCIEAGCDAQLTKPLTRARLVEMIGRFTGSSASRAWVDPEIADLIPGYLDARLLELDELDEALRAGEFDRIRRIGHALKGNGGSYGFPHLSELGGALESGALQRDAERIGREVAALRSSLRELASRFARTPPAPETT